MDAKVYNQKGASAGKVTLSPEIFGAVWNPDLVHQVVMAMQSNARTSVAHTKDRSEVRGGGRKPWKQKGTGRARHGSSRSPIWAGGGVTFGPRKEKSYAKKTTKKMRIKALYSVLSEKFRVGEVMFVDKITFEAMKTAQAREVLQALSAVSGFEMLASKKNNSALMTTTTKDENVYKSFGNFNNIAIEEIRNLNPLDILNYKYLVMVNPKESMQFLSSKLDKKEALGTRELGTSKETVKAKAKTKADKTVPSEERLAPSIKEPLTAKS